MSQYQDEWAAQVHSSRSNPLLENRDPLFASAKEFGRFVAVVREEHRWARCPIKSSAGDAIEVLKLGTMVQTSRRAPKMPSCPEVYHMAWTGRLIEEAANTAGADIIWAWGLCDVTGMTVRAVAEEQSASPTTAQRRINKGREAIYDHLLADGKAVRGRKRHRRRRVMAVRAEQKPAHRELPYE